MANSDNISPFEIMGKMSKRRKRRSLPQNVPNHAPDPYAGYKKTADTSHMQTDEDHQRQADQGKIVVQDKTIAQSTKTETESDHNPIFESKLLNVWQAPVTLRIPRGMLFIGFFLMTALVMLGYKAGQMSGKRKWQQAFEQIQSESQKPLIPLAAITTQPINTVLASEKLHHKDAGLTGGDLSIQKTLKAPDLRSEQGMQVIDKKRVGDLNWLEGRIDPRQKDYSYFVLIHANRRYAEKVVHFLAQEGVESAAIKRDNARLFKVVLLKSFTIDEEKSRTENYLNLRSQIRQLGRRWKSQMGGATAWEDFFAQRFDGKKEATVIRTMRLER